MRFKRRLAIANKAFIYTYTFLKRSILISVMVNYSQSEYTGYNSCHTWGCSVSTKPVRLKPIILIFDLQILHSFLWLPGRTRNYKFVTWFADTSLGMDGTTRHVNHALMWGNRLNYSNYYNYNSNYYNLGVSLTWVHD